MDDQLKNIVRQVRSVWPLSKPLISVQFWEKTNKDSEQFTILISDPEKIAPLNIGATALTYDDAIKSLSQNLSAHLHKIHNKVSEEAQEEMARVETFTIALKLAAQSLDSDQ